MGKKAVAYVREVDLGCGDTITREYQKAEIVKHAAAKGFEIVAWFEDETHEKEVLSRSGIKALLAFNEPYDLVLTERVWALSRNTEILERFFGELDRRAILFDCATTMWDCTSQKCRHRFYPALRSLNTESKADTGSVKAAPETKSSKFKFPWIFGNRHATA
jgi:DNA phosphorothioation-dependent restriction protein DptG